MLGFFNFLRDFIPNFASIAAPLEKLRKLRKITSAWGEAEEKAFQDLKYAVEHALVLSQPDWELEFQVACDASQDAVGAVLYQVTEDGSKKYVMLCSKTLQAGQRNYLASKRELLAIVFSLKKFQYYLLGRKFVVETDHKALTYLNLSTLFMILDWLDFLLQYDFTIVFIKGMENVLPDFLSCCCVKKEVPVEYELPLVGLDVRNVDCDSEPRVYTKERLEEFLNSVIDKCEPIDKDKLSLVQDKHNESHMGVSGTFNNLFRSGYYWSNMRKMVEEVCAGCMECLHYNVGKIGFHPLTPVSVTLPMDLIAIDFVCGLPETSDGFTVGLIIIDCATHFVFLHSLKSKSSEAVAEALLEVFCNFGFPWEIQSDQDPSFMSKSMDKFRELAEARSRKVLKYFPAQNGMVERYVKEVNNVLKKMMYGEGTYWVKFLPVIQLSLND